VAAGIVARRAGAFAFEKEIKKRLDWWAKQKSEGGGS